MNFRWLVRSALGIALCLGLSATALAQYGGGGGTGSTSTYSSTGKSYGSGAAIGIGVGAAAAVAIVAIAIHHRHAAAEEASVVGCTQEANGAASLVDENTKTTYSLISLSSDVKPGERVELVGKKSRDKSGKQTFRVEKMQKDYGPCTPQSAMNASGPAR